jgi:uncharacterized SAM-dependent methyltransferase
LYCVSHNTTVFLCYAVTKKAHSDAEISKFLLKGESTSTAINNTRLAEMLPTRTFSSLERFAKVVPTRTILSLGEDATNGLMSAPRSLPAKYLYDEKNSWLFDQICDSPEYYPTRAENALLEKVAIDIITEQKPLCIVELGSGTSRKTRHLFDACRKAGSFPTYVPIDVCDEILIASKNA